MSKRLFISIGALGSLCWALSSTPQALSPAASHSIAEPVQTYRTILDRYCVTCHNQRLQTGGVTLQSTDLSRVAEHSDLWEKVVRKLRVGTMPPQGAPRPDRATADALSEWLEGELDRAAAEKPDPGRPIVRRLNRSEYANAVRDLLALDVDVAALLPPDDSSYGFDNIADVLGVSPVLLDRYLAAADKISALAIGDMEIGPGSEVYRVRQDLSQDQQIEGLPLGTVGGVLVRHAFPLDAEYQIQVKLFRSNIESIRGLESTHQLEILVDGERVHLASLGGDTDFALAVDNPTVGGDVVDARMQVRMPVKAGIRQVGVGFIQKRGEGTRRLQPSLRSSADTFDSTGRPHVERFTIMGPFNATGPGDTPSRRRILTCRPSTSPGTTLSSSKGRLRNGSAEESCARQIVTTLTQRAFRRRATAAEIEDVMTFYRTGRQKGTFDKGVQMALRRVLASPRFLLRIERDRTDVPAGVAYRISDVELASRLSFFLWSSIPDDELLAVAEKGQLKDRLVLERQVRRMLADPKAQALVTNFAGQWLQLRNLRRIVPNSNEFPDFDDNLRHAFQREAELFFDSIIREDRNVLELITADYTFVNERLARHYGIPYVNGSHFRRVALADDARKGLLGKGGVLTVTSHVDRTSPVVRGKWLLENILGTPPPPPPADVPPLKEKEEGQKPRTMRERMEEHRRNTVCANCHKLMDPLGFALENFDAIGAWRTSEGGSPIDASGQLADGTLLHGVVTLRHALTSRPTVFVGTFTEKLLTYALGRGLTAHDMPVVRTIDREAAHDDHRFSSIVVGIVRSVPFQMRVKL
jgi:mono/diheme cytochrome c family protein